MNHIPTYNPTINDKKIFWLVLSIVLVKLFLLPFAQAVDSDAVTRTFISIYWLKNPIWITNCVWGPFHFYLTGFILTIWNNTVYAPVVFNIILSAITLVPFYYFVKREFNSNGAFIASFFLAISPIIFRNSLMNMSETPYLLLLTITLNYLSRGFHSRTASNYILAGLSITIAAGFRFEAWFFIPLFSFIVLIKKGKMSALLFFVVAMLYPMIDVTTHFIQDHYSFSGFFNNYPWNLTPNNIKVSVHFLDYLRRLWFIPLCWIITLGPLTFIVVKEIVFIRKRNVNLFWFAIVFWAFLLLTEVSAFKAAIILHERFSATITLLSLPFIASYFKDLSIKKVYITLFCGLLIVAPTYIYNLSNITPLPRLTDQNAEKVSKIINKKLTPESGLLIDFWGWGNTYYIGLQSKLSPQNINMTSGDDANKIQSGNINAIIYKHPQGIIIVVKNSLLWKNTVFSAQHLQFKFSDLILNAREIFNDNAVTVWEYKNDN